MTGNVVFLAFALVGAPGFSILASLVALGSFGGGLLGSRLGQHREHLLSVTAARKLAVPDLTTPVLTLTIVGIAADSCLIGGSGSRAGRHLIAVAAMFGGALVGSRLVFHVSTTLPLACALLVMAFIAVVTQVLSRTDPVRVRVS